jgi:hypothetical protein
MENPRKSSLSFKIEPILLIILAVAAFLLFYRLDHRPFWQDEAETACLARTILQSGLPQAFDGKNLISQEEGREFNSDYLWRWSPWLQLYLTAAAFRLGGVNTLAGRLPFACFGLLGVGLVYFLIKQKFADRPWALVTSALLGSSVPFLLFARQCRYYSLGAFLTLVALYAFRSNWQAQLGPACLLVLSLGLLFYANYVLFISFLLPALLAAVLLYPRELPVARALMLALGLGIIMVPGVMLFQLPNQVTMLLNWELAQKILEHLEKYCVDLLQFMVPLPVALFLLWRWRAIFWGGCPLDPKERFVVFLALIFAGNILVLLPVPQCEHRYLLHLYPLSAIILGWTVLRAWHYHKFSGALLFLLLAFTNWVQLVPMKALGIGNYPIYNDAHMLTHPNLPLKLMLTELFSRYPDVNQHLIDFFNSQANPGETILITYGDLPLQFYTPFQVLGGLQGWANLPTKPPDWIVKRWYTRWNRDYVLNASEAYILNNLRLPQDYQRVIMPWEDEIFGNRADPYYHRFIPPEPMIRMVIYRKKGNSSP